MFENGSSVTSNSLYARLSPSTFTPWNYYTRCMLLTLV